MTSEPIAVVLASPSDFDFWIGRWRGTWPANGETAAGSAITTVTLEYDGRVVFERFVADEPECLRGMSVSVFVPSEGIWKQTWVDNTGNYLDFVGGPWNGLVELHREGEGPEGSVAQRMIWFDVSSDRFEWEWQRSADDGLTWKTAWAISYARL